MLDLNLAERNIDTRDARNVEVFSLEKIKQYFDDSIALIMKQTSVLEKLMSEGRTEEAKDILCSQIVFLDSAFDFYMHELLKLGIINLFHGEWTPKTTKYLNLKLDMKTLELAVSDEESDEWLKQWINENYAGISFMSYEAFKEVNAILGLEVKKIADKAFYDLNSRIPTDKKIKNCICGSCIPKSPAFLCFRLSCFRN